MSQSDDYEFRPLELTEPELVATSDLLRRVFPHAPHLTPAYLRWLYVDNPDGRALGYNAYLEGRLIGHCAGSPLVAAIEGVRHRGIFLLNAAVRPRHIRHNITRRTTDPMFEEAARQGYSFAFALGNANSTLPLLTRFKMIKPLEARIGIGLPRRAKRTFAPSFERLWSHEAMAWRLANPQCTYSVVRHGDRATVIAPTGKRGVGAVLYDGPEAWPSATKNRKSRLPFRVWMGLDPGISWSGSAFLPIPRALRPSPLNLVFKDLSGGALHPDPDRILFRAIDFDPY